ncbi:Protein fmp52-1, mitochondrial [Talaromyces atroroseus]|uniref:Protein fmp52-1, mitochondrial n=1 Tax=Talaromyces atroroseus TaxID=1441469 RepID=A0A1Q5Q7B3_TALAT|nr:Protein fmp52-1, mitochondrial [Talaromyces atroroseus]OKL55739.1 Protein fmp52-1, mitochondrial [Talaromyces atroroseus]
MQLGSPSWVPQGWWTPAAAASSPNAKLTTFVESDTSRWAGQISQLSPPPSIFLSALGTTRSQAGGLENQYKLDLGLNIECAKAAREAGAKVYVLLSSSGANSSSMVPYVKLKGQCEEAAKELGFEHTVIVRPGLIVGQREESRPAEAALRFLASSFGKLHSSLKDSWAQDADVIAKAGISAGLKALAGDVPAGSEKVWILEQSDVLRLGREE